jgi:hypothetical protein
LNEKTNENPKIVKGTKDNKNKENVVNKVEDTKSPSE